jgi:hypothetical protein
MDRPARTLSGSLMHRVLSHAYVWEPIMAPGTFFYPASEEYNQLNYHVCSFQTVSVEGFTPLL